MPAARRRNAGVVLPLGSSLERRAWSCRARASSCPTRCCPSTCRWSRSSTPATAPVGRRSSAPPRAGGTIPDSSRGRRRPG